MRYSTRFLRLILITRSNSSQRERSKRLWSSFSFRTKYSSCYVSLEDLAGIGFAIRTDRLFLYRNWITWNIPKMEHDQKKRRERNLPLLGIISLLTRFWLVVPITDVAPCSIWNAMPSKETKILTKQRYARSAD